MASFAKLNDNNIVINLEYISDKECMLNGSVDEQTGINFLTTIHGYSNWKMYDPNMIGGVHLENGTPFRKNGARIGSTYDIVRDAFINPKPHNSWIFDETACLWKAPVEEPPYSSQEYNNGNDKYLTYWDEENLRWLATGSSDKKTYVWDSVNNSFNLLT